MQRAVTSLDGQSKAILIGFEELVADPRSHEQAVPYYAAALSSDSLRQLVTEEIKRWRRVPPSEPTLRQYIADWEQRFTAIHPVVVNALGHIRLRGGKATERGASNLLADSLFLDELQLDAVVASNKVLAVLFEQVPRPRRPCMPDDWPILTQSSEVLKPGSNLQITAGIGRMLMLDSGMVRIGKDYLPLTEGVAEKVLKVPRLPGRYSIPVSFRFKDQDGIFVTMNKDLFYNVVDTVRR